MRTAKLISVFIIFCCAWFFAESGFSQPSSQSSAVNKRIVIAASTVLDGGALDGDPLKDITAVRRGAAL